MIWQDQSRLNYNRAVHPIHTGGSPRGPDWEAVPLGLTGHVLHNPTLTSLGHAAAPPKKQTQGSSHDEGEMKQILNERTEDMSRKRTTVKPWFSSVLFLEQFGREHLGCQTKLHFSILDPTNLSC